MWTGGQNHVTVTWGAFEISKMTIFLVVHLGQALLWLTGSLEGVEKGNSSRWGHGHGDWVTTHFEEGHSYSLAVSIEQPWYLDSPHHQSPERLLRGEKCSSESRRWEKPAQICFQFLCYVLPRDTSLKGRNESFSFTTGSRKNISWLWFSNFL